MPPADSLQNQKNAESSGPNLATSEVSNLIERGHAILELLLDRGDMMGIRDHYRLNKHLHSEQQRYVGPLIVAIFDERKNKIPGQLKNSKITPDEIIQSAVHEIQKDRSKDFVLSVLRDYCQTKERAEAVLPLIIGHKYYHNCAPKLMKHVDAPFLARIGLQSAEELKSDIAKFMGEGKFHQASKQAGRLEEFEPENHHQTRLKVQQFLLTNQQHEALTLLKSEISKSPVYASLWKDVENIATTTGSFPALNMLYEKISLRPARIKSQSQGSSLIQFLTVFKAYGNNVPWPIAEQIEKILPTITSSKFDQKIKNLCHLILAEVALNQDDLSSSRAHLQKLSGTYQDFKILGSVAIEVLTLERPILQRKIMLATYSKIVKSEDLSVFDLMLARAFLKHAGLGTTPIQANFEIPEKRYGRVLLSKIGINHHRADKEKIAFVSTTDLAKSGAYHELFEKILSEKDQNPYFPHRTKRILQYAELSQNAGSGSAVRYLLNSALSQVVTKIDINRFDTERGLATLRKLNIHTDLLREDKFADQLLLAYLNVCIGDQTHSQKYIRAALKNPANSEADFARKTLLVCFVNYMQGDEAGFERFRTKVLMISTEIYHNASLSSPEFKFWKRIDYDKSTPEIWSVPSSSTTYS